MAKITPTKRKVSLSKNKVTASKSKTKTTKPKIIKKPVKKNVVVEVEKAPAKPYVAKKPKATTRDALEQIMFRLPDVSNPFEGTPKDVQKELDNMVIKMQKDPDDNVMFNRIHLYIHGYLINTVLKKFPYIRGLQTVDVYQETLIALKFKAIPNFKKGKGMSFLNFAKMCIRRHLITLLNASKNRKKDQSINQAISLDSSPIRDDPDDTTTFASIITDENSVSADVELSNCEAFAVTKHTLMSQLSDFEQLVLSEFLSSSSYREISRSISKNLDKRYNTKSVDNALLRIRTKAASIREHSKADELPIFIS